MQEVACTHCRARLLRAAKQPLQLNLPNRNCRGRLLSLYQSALPYAYAACKHDGLSSSCGPRLHFPRGRATPLQSSNLRMMFETLLGAHTKFQGSGRDRKHQKPQESPASIIKRARRTQLQRFAQSAQPVLNEHAGPACGFVTLAGCVYI